MRNQVLSVIDWIVEKLYLVALATMGVLTVHMIASLLSFGFTSNTTFGIAVAALSVWLYKNDFTPEVKGRR